MKFFNPLLFPLFTIALAAPDVTNVPASTPASAYLAGLTGVPTTVTGGAYTSLASALHSVDEKYFNDDRYRTVMEHVFSAAAKASDSVKVVPSLALSSFSWPDVTAAAWYDKDVPKDDKKYISSYIEDYNKAYQKVVDGDDEDSAASRDVAVVWSAAALAGILALALAL